MENGTKDDDENHVADCWYVTPKRRISLGVRMFRPEMSRREFYVRGEREGRPTEAAALARGENTYEWYLTVWQPRGNDKPEFILLDVLKMREAGLLQFPGTRWHQRPAWDDGEMSRTEFFYAEYADRLFNEGFAIKAWFYDRPRESDFMEEILAVNMPRQLSEN